MGSRVEFHSLRDYLVICGIMLFNTLETKDPVLLRLEHWDLNQSLSRVYRCLTLPHLGSGVTGLPPLPLDLRVWKLRNFLYLHLRNCIPHCMSEMYTNNSILEQNFIIDCYWTLTFIKRNLVACISILSFLSRSSYPFIVYLFWT